MLERDAIGRWSRPDKAHVSLTLSRLYGFSIDITRKCNGLNVVAAALESGQVARAQIAALLLQLPDPPAAEKSADSERDRGRLARGLIACGLIKAEDGWDEEHPRLGAAPNAGWFAVKPSGSEPTAAASGGSSAPQRGDSGAGVDFAFTSLSTTANSVLSHDLSPTALEGLATLAGRYGAPAILFGAIFVPSANAIVDEGAVPGRSDIRYRWAHDEASVTFKVLIDGAWKTLTGSGLAGCLSIAMALLWRASWVDQAANHPDHIGGCS